MSCKCCYRLFIFVLLTALVICTIISVVSPLMTRNLAGDRGSTMVLSIGFVNIDNTTTTAAGTVVKTRTHTRDVTCKTTKSYFLAAFALIVVAAILGALNVFCALVWVMAPCGFPIGVIVILLNILCFAGTFIPFALILLTVANAYCSDALSLALASDAKDSLYGKHGIVLLLVAFVGFFLTLVIQIVGCACGCQLERSNSVKARDTTVEGLEQTSQYGGRAGSSYQGTEMSYRPFTK